MTSDDAALPAGPPPPVAAASAPPRSSPLRAAAPPIESESLFRGAAEVQIAHHGSLYRLKQTALGKLILTK